MMANTTITIYASVQAAKDSMKVGEMAFANESGSKTILIKNAADGYETFSNSGTDLAALLALSTFASLTELIQKVAYLRDHAVTDQ